MTPPLPLLRLSWRRLGLSEIAAHRLALLQLATISAPATDKAGA